MQLPISLTSAVLPTTNIHPHGHHRGGSQLGTLLDPSSATQASGNSGTAAASSASSTKPAPDGSTKGLFSTILNSIEGVIGASTGISVGSILNTKA